MSQVQWDKSTSRGKITSLLSPEETGARIVELLQFTGWEIAKPSNLSGGCRISAVKWVSRTAQLTSLTESGRKTLGAWKLLGKFPAPIDSNGIALTKYRYRFSAWILESGGKTVVDYSVTEEIDPLCGTIADRINFSIPSRIGENDLAKSIEHALRVDSTQVKTGSVRIVSVTQNGPQLSSQVTGSLLKAA